MTKAEIFENLMLPLKGSLTSESWNFLLGRGQMFVEQTSSKNDDKPLVSGSLPVAEHSVIDKFGHNTKWKFCPGCGIDWDVDEGADQFGCWSCGFVRQ